MTASSSVLKLITPVSQYTGLLMVLTGVCEPESEKLSRTNAINYCLLLSAAFAGSLYLLVPKSIRKLDRDDPKQIQWRILATGIICLATSSLHRYLFCKDKPPPLWMTDFGEDDSDVDAREILSMLASKMMQVMITSTGVLTHLIILYVGHILATSLEISLLLSGDGPVTVRHLWEGINAIYFGPLTMSLTHGGAARWICLRNLFVAPFAEELVFRAHMVPLLQSTGTISVPQLCRTAPLFFGIAHAHHAFRRLQQREKFSLVLFQTLFQFTYTSIFGAYATYVYIQTGSLSAITVAHSFCNWMGLPSLGFMSKSSSLYGHRKGLLAAYIVGILIFALEFKLGILMRPSSSSAVPVPGVEAASPSI